MAEFRKANISDVEKLSTLRVAMVCESKDYDNIFKEKLYANTLSYLTDGFNNNSISVWVATESKK